MFEFIHPWDDVVVAIIGGAVSLAAIVAAVAYTLSIIKNQKTKADSDTIQTYRDEIDALKLKVERIDEDNRQLREIVDKVKQENESLKKFNALQDTDFRKQFLEMATCVQKMSEDFRSHYKDDQKRFSDILKAVQGIKGAK